MNDKVKQNGKIVVEDDDEDTNNLSYSSFSQQSKDQKQK